VAENSKVCHTTSSEWQKTAKSVTLPCLSGRKQQSLSHYLVRVAENSKVCHTTSSEWRKTAKSVDLAADFRRFRSFAAESRDQECDQLHPTLDNTIQPHLS